MQVTEVRIKLMEDAGERLQAFCSITLDDCFVVRDLKIIEGTNGPFVAMPSRKLTAHCGQCGCKNYLRAVYCNQCGLRLSPDKFGKDEEGRAKLYADIAHPINSACRELIQNRVIEEFHAELERAKLPGYVSRYDEFDHEDIVVEPQQPAKTFRYDSPEKSPVQPPSSPPARRPAQVQIQPAEQQPRPPHSAKSNKHAAQSPVQSPAPHSNDDFGAGIF